MYMKSLLISTCLLCCSIFAGAQNFSSRFTKVYQACMDLRAASVTGSASLMKSACCELKSEDVRYFSTLACLDDVQLSLNGHFIFDYEFVDSLIVNKSVYRFAQNYAERSAGRFASTGGRIYIKTCCVAASSSSRYSFVAQGHQELAVVSEGGGLLNLRVYDATNNVWHNDDQDLNKGLPSRTRVFDIPGGNALLEIEIINKTDKDISFVVLSN